MDALSSVRKNALVICGKCLSFRFDVQNKKESRDHRMVLIFLQKFLLNCIIISITESID